MNSFLINQKQIGEGQPMYLIAEVGLAHDGSLGAAHAFIDSVSSRNVDAIKFQTHIPEQESSQYEQFRVNVFPQDASRRDYWNRTSFSKSQWLELAAHCREAGIDFLSSAFSELAVDWLEECGVGAWKVASGEVTNLPMLEKMVATGKPLLVSSGMSTWAELDWVAGQLNDRQAEFAVFQCTTAYPCPPETWGLNVIDQMSSRYECPVGFSDHSGDIFAGIGARLRGASLLEFHVTFDKEQFGPDTLASLTMDQVEQLVRGIRNLEASLDNPVNKDQVAEGLLETRSLFAKGLYARQDLPAGTTLTAENVDVLKPLMGIAASEYHQSIGRITCHPIEAGEPIKSEHLQ